MGISSSRPNRVPLSEHSDPDPVSDPSSGWFERFGDGSIDPERQARAEQREREAEAGKPGTDDTHSDPVWAREDVALGLAIPRGPKEEVRKQKTRPIYQTEPGVYSSLLERLGDGPIDPDSPEWFSYRETYREEQQRKREKESGRTEPRTKDSDETEEEGSDSVLEDRDGRSDGNGRGSEKWKADEHGRSDEGRAESESMGIEALGMLSGPRGGLMRYHSYRRR